MREQVKLSFGLKNPTDYRPERQSTDNKTHSGRIAAIPLHHYAQCRIEDLLKIITLVSISDIVNNHFYDIFKKVIFNHNQFPEYTLAFNY